jgi:hypothetical protein
MKQGDAAKDRSGFIVPPWAPEALAGGIISLIQDSYWAKQMGIVGRR